MAVDEESKDFEGTACFSSFLTGIISAVILVTNPSVLVRYPLSQSLCLGVFVFAARFYFIFYLLLLFLHAYMVRLFARSQVVKRKMLCLKTIN